MRARFLLSASSSMRAAVAEVAVAVGRPFSLHRCAPTLVRPLCTRLRRPTFPTACPARTLRRFSASSSASASLPPIPSPTGLSSPSSGAADAVTGGAEEDEEEVLLDDEDEAWVESKLEAAV